MSLFGHDEEPADLAGGGEDSVFEVLGPDGGRVRYAPDDFDEVFTTTDEHEAGRHVSLGWLLLDEVVDFEPGTHASWIDTLLRREAGRVLPAADDPAYSPGRDVTTYVLGYLKPGRTGTPLA
jgi:hypothetical protein